MKRRIVNDEQAVSPVIAVILMVAITVVLAAAGDQKINVIKEVRAITGLGLKEAKEMVEGAPSDLKEDVPTAEANELKEKLEGVGATVELK